MHKQAIKHKQAIIGGGYLFTEKACFALRASADQFICEKEQGKWF